MGAFDSSAYAIVSDGICGISAHYCSKLFRRQLSFLHQSIDNWVNIDLGTTHGQPFLNFRTIKCSRLVGVNQVENQHVSVLELITIAVIKRFCHVFGNVALIH